MSDATVSLREKCAELEEMARGQGQSELVSACALTAKVAIELDERISALEARPMPVRRRLEPHPFDIRW